MHLDISYSNLYVKNDDLERQYMFWNCSIWMILHSVFHFRLIQHEFYYTVFYMLVSCILVSIFFKKFGKRANYFGFSERSMHSLLKFCFSYRIVHVYYNKCVMYDIMRYLFRYPVVLKHIRYNKCIARLQPVRNIRKNV